MRTRRRALAVLVVAASAIVTGAAPWAGALEQEGMTIAEGEVVESTYGPIAGNNAALTHYPDECVTSTYCDVVPLDVIVPEDLEPGDDFIVKITVAWPEQAANTPGYRGSTNDLDIYVYDDKQEETANPPEDGAEPDYTEKSSGASDQNPEELNLFRPTLGRYNIVINNFLGTNVGYTITLEWESFEVDPAIELLAPRSEGPRRTTTTTTRPSTTTTAAAATSTTVSIPEGAVLPDDDFDGDAFAQPTASQESLDAIAAIERMGGAEESSPSALSVVLWMVVLPAAVVAGAAAFIARSRRSRRSRQAAPA